MQTCKFKSSFKKNNMTFVTEYIPECYASRNFPFQTKFLTLNRASMVHIAQNPEFFIEI